MPSAPNRSVSSAYFSAEKLSETFDPLGIVLSAAASDAWFCRTIRGSWDANRLPNAVRCRELDRIAVNPEIKAQLREWVGDLEAEATEYERSREQAPQRRLARSR